MFHADLDPCCDMQMLLEVQQMHDDVLEYKVDLAISSNRLTRLDNPILHDKLKSLKRQAEQISQSTRHAEERGIISKSECNIDSTTSHYICQGVKSTASS